MQTKRNVRVALLLSAALCGALGQGQAQGVTPSVFPAAGQSGEPVLVSGGQQFDLKSRANGQTYRIFVAGPVTPAAGGSYPVVYLLDGNAVFATAADMARVQKGLGPVIVVGVGYPVSGAFDVMRRYYDLTPLTPPDKLDIEPPPPTPPRTGGQEEFFQFLEEQVKPEIQNRFPVDRSRQTLFGHSLGGRFTLHVLFHHPEAFQTYVAASPSLWWNAGSMRDEVRERVKEHRPLPAGVSLLITVGGLEQTPRPTDTAERAAQLKRYRMVNSAREVAKQLTGLSQEGNRVAFREFAGENHPSNLPVSALWALRFTLDKTIK